LDIGYSICRQKGRVMIFYGMMVGHRQERVPTKPDMTSVQLKWIRSPSRKEVFAILDAYATNEFDPGYILTVTRAYPLKLLIWLLFGVEL